MIGVLIVIVAALVAAEMVYDLQRYAERYCARKHAND